MGAGAVGCYYGGMLARAGHDVVLIGRPAHVEAIRRQGLRIESPSRGMDVHIPLRASTGPEAVAGADWVLLCVKATDTELAAAQMRPHLAPGARVVTLQNGVDNADRLRRVLAQEVHASVVYVGTGMAGPGHVLHHGRGELVLEPGGSAEALQALCVQAGLPVELSGNIRGALWAKLIVNCVYNALSAITQQPYGEVVEGEGISQVMQDVTTECVAVAQAEGVQLPGDLAQLLRNIVLTVPTQHSSTAQDLARGKPSEIDHLNGFVVRRGEVLGVPTPANRVLHAVVKLLEVKAVGRAATGA